MDISQYPIGCAFLGFTEECMPRFTPHPSKIGARVCTVIKSGPNGERVELRVGVNRGGQRWKEFPAELPVPPTLTSQGELPANSTVVRYWRYDRHYDLRKETMI